MQGRILLHIDNTLTSDHDPIQVVVAVDVRKPEPSLLVANKALDEISRGGGKPQSGKVLAAVDLYLVDASSGQEFLQELDESLKADKKA